DLVLVLDDARVRKADRVQQTGIELDNRRVRIPFAGLRTHALRDDGACARLIHAAHRTARLVEKTGRQHRRVPQGDAGDLRPEVHHRRTEMTELLKVLGPREYDRHSEGRLLRNVSMVGTLDSCWIRFWGRSHTRAVKAAM